MERRNKKTKSVGNGEGTLYYSETLKRWVFQYYDTSGKRQTMKQWKTETTRDFKARVTEAKNSLNNGTYIGKSNDTLYSIIKQHIQQKLDDGIISEISYKRNLETLAQLEFCCSEFIHKSVQKVDVPDVEKSKKLMRETYSQSCINKMWMLLIKGFQLAYSRRKIQFNIMNDENLKKPLSNKDTKKVYPLTQKEREKLQSVLDNEERNHPYRNIVMLEWLTAMRIGEVLARSRNDLDKNITKLHIHNTLTKDKNGKIIINKHTKTYNKRTGIDEGERYFPLSKEEKEIINEQLSLKVTNIHYLLFWDYEKNTFISGSEINSWLDRINKKYKISDKKIHNHRLRHDRMTQWKEAGVDRDAIKYFAGHTEDSSVTDEYIDVSQEYAFEELKKTK